MSKSKKYDLCIRVITTTNGKNCYEYPKKTWHNTLEEIKEKLNSLSKVYKERYGDCENLILNYSICLGGKLENFVETGNIMVI